MLLAIPGHISTPYMEVDDGTQNPLNFFESVFHVYIVQNCAVTVCQYLYMDSTFLYGLCTIVGTVEHQDNKRRWSVVTQK